MNGKTWSERMAEAMVARSDAAYERMQGAVRKGPGFEAAVKFWERQTNKAGRAAAYCKSRMRGDD